MNLQSSEARRNFARFAWAVLAYNLAVILWGAYVRASFSGDGCGAHWPTCAGQLLPSQMAAPRLIEFTHRMMTTLDVGLTAILCVWAFRAYPKGHGTRRYSILAAAFLFVEALLGAGLVLFRFVAHDASAGRAPSMALHLTNTLLLLGSYTITAWLAQRGEREVRFGAIPKMVKVAAILTFVVSISGAIAALGDMLYPAATLAKGVVQDLSPGSDLLVRLRMVHPFVAVVGAAFLLWAAFGAMKNRGDGDAARTAGTRVAVMVFAQIMAGLTNLYLLAPMAMQLLHLAIADLVWISLVVLACEEARAGKPALKAQPSSMVAVG